MLLRYRADCLNVIRALTAPIIFFYPFIYGLPESGGLLASLLLWALLNDINHVLHLHIHLPFTHSRIINLVLDTCMGVVTGMTASNWRIQHKFGHHWPRVGEFCKGHPWEMERFTIGGAIWYSLRTTPPIFYKPFLEAFNKGILNNQKRPINYRFAFFEQLALIIFVICLYQWQPQLVLYYMLPWYFLVFFVTRYTDYLNHVACETKAYQDSNNCLNKLYNLLGCNFGYHTAHHHRPSAHWTDLPTIHSQIADKIPTQQKKNYSWSGFMMPYHFYLALRKRI